MARVRRFGGDERADLAEALPGRATPSRRASGRTARPVAPSPAARSARAARRRPAADWRPASRTTAARSARPRRAAPRPRGRPRASRRSRPPPPPRRSALPAPPSTARPHVRRGRARPTRAPRFARDARARSRSQAGRRARARRARRARSPSSSSRPTTSSCHDHGAAGPVERPKNRRSVRITRNRSARNGTTGSHKPESPSPPWSRRSAGPLPASSYQSLAPFTSTVGTPRR